MLVEFNAGIYFQLLVSFRCMCFHLTPSTDHFHRRSY